MTITDTTFTSETTGVTATIRARYDLNHRTGVRSLTALAVSVPFTTTSGKGATAERTLIPDAWEVAGYRVHDEAFTRGGRSWNGRTALRHAATVATATRMLDLAMQDLPAEALAALLNETKREAASNLDSTQQWLDRQRKMYADDAAATPSETERDAAAALTEVADAISSTLDTLAGPAKVIAANLAQAQRDQAAEMLARPTRRQEYAADRIGQAEEQVRKASVHYALAHLTGAARELAITLAADWTGNGPDLAATVATLLGTDAPSPTTWAEEDEAAGAERTEEGVTYLRRGVTRQVAEAAGTVATDWTVPGQAHYTLRNIAHAAAQVAAAAGTSTADEIVTALHSVHADDATTFLGILANANEYDLRMLTISDQGAYEQASARWAEQAERDASEQAEASEQASSWAEAGDYEQQAWAALALGNEAEAERLLDLALASGAG